MLCSCVQEDIPNDLNAQRYSMQPDTADNQKNWGFRTGQTVCSQVQCSHSGSE